MVFLSLASALRLGFQEAIRLLFHGDVSLGQSQVSELAGGLLGAGPCKNRLRRLAETWHVRHNSCLFVSQVSIGVDVVNLDIRVPLLLRLSSLFGRKSVEHNQLALSVEGTDVRGALLLPWLVLLAQHGDVVLLG